ncbi:MAG: SHOCT domain-containing protein [Acidimicrobiia bacterium]|nr:SHOCT domain-containing protein [Acidimicrobiia bacterium]
MFAASSGWGVGEVLWTFLWFTCFFIWIWLAVSVFIDIFRSHDMGGIHKAIWVVAIFALPLIGVLAYLIVRGGKMNQHAIAAAKAQDDAMQAYIRQAAGTTPADELHRLDDLRSRGVIDEAEFQKLKAKVVS